MPLFVHQNREPNLPQVAAALHPASRLASRLDRRQEQRDQHAHDRDDRQQFHKAERPGSERSRVSVARQD